MSNSFRRSDSNAPCRFPKKQRKSPIGIGIPAIEVVTAGHLPDSAAAPARRAREGVAAAEAAEAEAEEGDLAIHDPVPAEAEDINSFSMERWRHVPPSLFLFPGFLDKALVQFGCRFIRDHFFGRLNWQRKIQTYRFFPGGQGR